MEKMGGLEMGRPFLLPRFCCRALCGRALVILNLFQDNVPPSPVILNLFQDNKGVWRHSSPTSKPRRSPG
jgi:hypothetical protein